MGNHGRVTEVSRGRKTLKVGGVVTVKQGLCWDSHRSGVEPGFCKCSRGTAPEYDGVASQARVLEDTRQVS
jgi:hypothetical protein